MRMPTGVNDVIKIKIYVQLIPIAMNYFKNYIKMEF